MRKTYLLLSIIALCSICFAAPPRLTVVVAVEGLSDQMIDQYGTSLPEGGLQHVLRTGQRTSCTYSQELYGGSETVATLFTGAPPSTHNYCADEVFSRPDKHTRPTLEDKHAKGICAAEQLSCRAITTPTLTDRLRLTYGEESKIYALGIHPNTVILMAGHAAQGCCWLNPTQLKWATTSAYDMGLLSIADAQNTNGTVQTTLTKPWSPLLPLTDYRYAGAEEKKKGFYILGMKTPLHTPACNELVISLTDSLIRSEQLGADDIPDMLCVELTCVTPNTRSDLLQSAEQEDMFLRLNLQLGHLIDILNREVGPHAYQLVVVGLPRKGIDAEQYRRLGMDTRQLDINRVAALLSSYLIALHGNEQWIEGVHLGSVFLNHQALSKHKLSVETVQQEVADFLSEFEGIQIAYTQRQFTHSNLSHTLGKSYIGDVVFYLQPMWQMVGAESRFHPLICGVRPTSPVLLLHSLIGLEAAHMEATDFPSLLLR